MDMTRVIYVRKWLIYFYMCDNVYDTVLNTYAKMVIHIISYERKKHSILKCD